MLHYMSSDGTIVGDLESWIKDHKLEKYQNNFSVASILGPQSSGKSTLLNHLYGTKFTVMNHELGHSRTTQGIWMSVSEEVDNSVTIILDVEGTDSKEGNQDNLTFERRTALLSLAISDCLIINTSYQSLGNFVASNYHILKTIMEAILELFLIDNNSSKTTLLFTIRDWTRNNSLVTPISVIEKEIREKYIEDIWSKIHKPVQYANAEVSQFFNIRVMGVGHPLFQPLEFKESIEDLKKIWNKSIKSSHYTRNIPMESWALYCENVWKMIIENRDLDIPSITEMISMTKCREVMEMILNKAEIEIKKQQKMSKMAEMDDFVGWAQPIIINYIEIYAENTSRHKAKIANEIKLEMILALIYKIQEVASLQFEHIAKKLLAAWTTKIWKHFQDTLSIDEPLSKDSPVLLKMAQFGDYKKEMTSNLLNQFNDIVKEHSITFFDEHQDFSAVSSQQFLEANIKSTFDSLHGQLFDSLLKSMQLSIHEEFKEIKEFVTNQENDAKDFWVFVNGKIASLPEVYKYSYCVAWMDLQSDLTTDLTFSDFECLCRTQAIFELIPTMTEIYSQSEALSMEIFKAAFVPPEKAKWTDLSKENIQEIFSAAQKKVSGWIYVWEELEISYENTTLSEEKKKNFEKKLRQNSKKDKTMAHFLTHSQEQLVYVLTLRDKNLTGWSSIPFLFWLLLFIVGFDELLSIIKLLISPYFILCAIICGSLFIFSSQIEDSLGGPYIQMSMSVIKKILINLYTLTKNSFSND